MHTLIYQGGYAATFFFTTNQKELKIDISRRLAPSLPNSVNKMFQESRLKKK